MDTAEILESLGRSACAKCPYSAWFVSDWPSEHANIRPGGHLAKRPFAFCKVRHVAMVDELVEECDVQMAAQKCGEDLKKYGNDHHGSNPDDYIANLTQP